MNKSLTLAFFLPVRAVAGSFLLAVAAVSTAIAVPITERVSVSSTGAQGDNTSALETFDGTASPPGISNTGRYVTFNSRAANFTANDTNTLQDVFRRDRTKGITAVLSDPTVGFDSIWPSISSSGRYLAFRTNTGLILADDCCSLDVYRKDMTTGELKLATGLPASLGDSPKLSANGNVVVFTTQIQLVPQDTDGNKDIYAYDFTTGVTERISVSTSGGNSNGLNDRAAVSSTGRYVTFSSTASNLVTNDANVFTDVFVRDRQTGKTTLVTFNSGTGLIGNNHSGDAEISANGRYIVYTSDASNLVAGDTNNNPDVFLHDRTTHITSRVSLANDGAQASLGGDSPAISVSATGNFVAFRSISNNLVAGDTNARADIFVRDLINSTTTRVSVDTAGAEGNHDSWLPMISGDGNSVIFISQASNLVPNDTNGFADVFVRRWR